MSETGWEYDTTHKTFRPPAVLGPHNHIVGTDVLVPVGSVTSSMILDGTIAAADIATATITLDKFASEVWTSYTPTLTQNGAVTKTTTYARYVKIGRTVIAQVQLDVTGTGNATTDVVIGLPSPTPVLGVGASLGVGSIYNASNFATYPGEAELASSTTLILKNTTASGIQVLGSANFTEALANGDVVRYNICYEATT